MFNMFNMFKGILFVLVVLLVLVQITNQTRTIGENYVNIEFKQHELEIVQKLEAIFERGRTENSIRAYLTNEQLEFLKNKNIKVEPIYDHLSPEHYNIEGKAILSIPNKCEVVYSILEIEDLGDNFWNCNHDYISMSQYLSVINDSYEFVKLTSLGTSIQGRQIWSLCISDQYRNNLFTTGIPKFKYVGNMHGDEVVGREILLHLIYDIVMGVESGEADMYDLIVDTDICIVPTMNPDGYELKRRGNANNVDLNRDFPDQFDGDHVHEKETDAIMQWSLANHFILSANLHGGDLVVNYPYDGNAGHYNYVYSSCPDDELFKYISKKYSTLSSTMMAGDFTDGITNGAEWYILYGGMQDWNYVYTSHTFEVTIELSYVKWPSSSDFSSYYDENKLSLINYIKQVHIGVKGRVVCLAPDVLNVGIIIPSISETHYVTVDINGYFYRPLTAGTYDITVVCTTSSGQVTTVVTTAVSEGSAVDLGVITV